MANILLLGAGFSKNWGGLLAREFVEELIADPQLRDDKNMRDLLFAHQNNFEKALEVLQLANAKEPKANGEPLKRLEDAINRLFGKMNGILENQQFYLLDANGHLDGATRPELFLTQFRQLFTLNQDLLLEYNYLDDQRYLNGVWNSVGLPGLVPVTKKVGNKTFSSPTFAPGGSLDVPSTMQPYYKLHGSVNWSGNGMMIMGTGKVAAIQGNDLLAAYHKEFATSLQTANTRMTIIGYGFADDHINEAIEVAVRNHGLKFFVVDPRGTAIATDARPGDKNFEEWFKHGLRSVSKLDIRYLLRDDSMDRQRLRDFLAGK